MHEAYIHRVSDHAFYEATELKKRGFPIIYFANVDVTWTYTRLMTYPSTCIFAIRIDAEASLRNSAIPCHGALFDEAGECHGYGSTTAVLSKQRDSRFTPFPLDSDWRQLIVRTLVPRKTVAAAKL